MAVISVHDEKVSKFVRSLGLDPGNVSRVVVDLDTQGDGLVKVYVEMIASEHHIEVLTDAIQGVEIKVV